MEIPLHPSCRILKAESGLIAVDKAEGVLSHPNPGEDPAPSGTRDATEVLPPSRALLPFPYAADLEAYLAPDGPLYLLNRLDAPTSGVILLASDPAVAAAVKAAFEGHAVRKTYAAVVKGIPPRRKEVWRDCLETRRRGQALRTFSIPGKPNAETAVELLERGAGPPARCLVALHPATGRTHQLRVQCSARRLPIIGDATYGDFAFNREFKRRCGTGRLLLHSWKTGLEVQVAGKRLAFAAESPLPGAFAVALR